EHLLLLVGGHVQVLHAAVVLQHAAPGGGGVRPLLRQQAPERRVAERGRALRQVAHVVVGAQRLDRRRHLAQDERAGGGGRHRRERSVAPPEARQHLRLAVTLGEVG